MTTRRASSLLNGRMNVNMRFRVYPPVYSPAGDKWILSISFVISCYHRFTVCIYRGDYIRAGHHNKDLVWPYVRGRKGDNRPKCPSKLRCPCAQQVLYNFKTVSTRKINRFRNNPGCPVWQRNYYERVIRNEDELSRARQYIANNPMKWELDKENPDNCRDNIK